MKQQFSLRVKRIFTNNIGLKLLALVFSATLWLLVVNVDDPTQTKTFTTAATIINEEVLTDMGKYYAVPDNNYVVSFRVTARRSVIEHLSGSDFTATADMKYLENDGRIPVSIKYQGTYTGVSISGKRVYLQIQIGEEMSTKHQIEVETTGEPASGCSVASVSVEPESVMVTGPVEIVREISRVVAYVDVEDANDDVTDSAVLHFLDKEGGELDQSRLKLDHNEIQVTAHILHRKTVAVEAQTSGTLAEGLYLESISVQPATVDIVGDSEILNDITTIEIASSVVNLSQITGDITTTVDLSTYLPEGVSLSDSSKNQAQITVKISTSETRIFRIPTANLTVRNLQEGLSADFPEETLDVSLKGKKSDLDTLTDTILTGYVDVSGLAAGSHTVPVYLDISKDDQRYTVEAAAVIVEIKE